MVGRWGKQKKKLQVPIRTLSQEAGALVPHALRPAWGAVCRGDSAAGHAATAGLRGWLSDPNGGAAAGMRMATPAEWARGLGLATYLDPFMSAEARREPRAPISGPAWNSWCARWPSADGSAAPCGPLRAAPTMPSCAAPGLAARQAALAAAASLAPAGHVPPRQFAAPTQCLGAALALPPEAAAGRPGVGGRAWPAS